MSKNIEIVIPDIGDFAEVEIIEILVAKGDSVSAEDPVITLESDKATMEIPAPADGVIDSISVSVGDKVSEGNVIGTLISGSAESAASAPAEEAEAPPAEEAAPEPEAKTAPEVQSESQPQFKPPESLPPPVERSGDALPHASPGIRRFARELGADLSQVRGSGPKGRILKEDVKSWIKAQLSSTESKSGSGAGIPPIPEVDFSKFGEVETISLSRIKKLSGPHLQRAWLNIPHVTHHDEADVTELEDFRRSLKEEAAKEGIKVTMLAFVIKILVGALKKYPQFNASLHGNGENLILKKYFNIGIAVDTDQGLVVPVIKEADRKSIFELAREMGEVSQRARDGKLKSDDLQGGCMSISSLGGIGGTAFTPIINAPEVAILGIARSRMTPVWDGKEFQPRLMLPLDLSYDHRVIDGAEAARFMVYLTQSFGDVRRLAL